MEIKARVYLSNEDFERQLSGWIQKGYEIISTGYDSNHGWWFIIKSKV